MSIIKQRRQINASMEANKIFRATGKDPRNIRKDPVVAADIENNLAQLHTEFLDVDIKVQPASENSKLVYLFTWSE